MGDDTERHNSDTTELDWTEKAGAKTMIGRPYTAHHFAEGGVIVEDKKITEAYAKAFTSAEPKEEETKEEKTKPRAEVLDTAKQLVLNDRNNQYGPPTQDFTRVAAIANLMGFRMVSGEGEVIELLPEHVALFQIFVKLSRLQWNTEKFDSWVDLAGYAACGWECVGDA